MTSNSSVSSIFSNFTYLKPEWPNPNPRILALEEHDAENASDEVDFRLRELECILLERLVPEYLLVLFGENHWLGRNGDLCFGLRLVDADHVDNERSYFTFKFALGHEIAGALGLLDGSTGTVLFRDLRMDHEFYRSDAFDAIELRFGDRDLIMKTNTAQMLADKAPALRDAISGLKGTVEAAKLRSDAEEMVAIKKIMMNLVSLYRRDADRLETIGNWYGLDERSCSVSSNLYRCKITYEIDNDLCEVLEVQSGTTCTMEEYEIWWEPKFEIDNFNGSSKDLAKIKKALEMSMPGVLLRTPGYGGKS